ncbi:response regulator transcription factor [Marivirga harenae]|uniref:response regulator transcription factor n=1 Tax=Marivirga harenae TaxID=2010992 RepID=UPI0026E028CB|nr:response regulator transcription factor [Marivirga harenae]WKV11621.1 response regulator transcription factor [Marivirga harenae]|tara:strand:+ start:124179 stop:124796 length:618 start_codon:yes stop_codon:yes gene_type:complete
MNKIKIILADDHQMILDGLSEVLRKHQDLELIGQFPNGKEVIEFVKSNKVDVAIMDINMPELDGISCAKLLKQDFPEIKIIMLTMYAQKSFIDEIIKLGIEGCLLKNNSGKELHDAILRVQSGKYYYDKIKDFTDPTEEIASYKLGEREIEIIKLLAEGLGTNEIATKLYISTHTVSTHRKNILHKTGVNNTTQLVQFAYENHLI